MKNDSGRFDKQLVEMRLLFPSHDQRYLHFQVEMYDKRVQRDPWKRVISASDKGSDMNVILLGVKCFQFIIILLFLK